MPAVIGCFSATVISTFWQLQCKPNQPHCLKASDLHHETKDNTFKMKKFHQNVQTKPLPHCSFAKNSNTLDNFLKILLQLWPCLWLLALYNLQNPGTSFHPRNKTYHCLAIILCSFWFSLCLCIATDDIKGGINMRNLVGRPVVGHESLTGLW